MKKGGLENVRNGCKKQGGERAKATGAKALITSCPWCERNFKDAIKEYGEKIEIYDIAEITRKALQIQEK